MGIYALQQKPMQAAEYIVYTFGSSKQEQGNPRMWEKKASHLAAHEAVEQAEELFLSGKYSKIEIKQKYFDSRQNRNVHATFKTIGLPSRKFNMRTAGIVIFSLACAATAFGVVYFLSNGS